MSRAAKSYSIISGHDGPTSIFIVGQKEANFLKRMKNFFQNRKYKRKSERAKKSIVVGVHTMEDTILYMKQRYGAVEADTTYPYYSERKQSMKYSLIQVDRPELIGSDKAIPPVDFNKEEEIIKWHKQLEEWTKKCQQKAESIPYEVFPTEFHLFIIDKGEQGTLEIEIDLCNPTISISYSGEMKAMEPILKDIYLYYGVSQEDIEEQTIRYKTLLATLSY